MDQRSWRAMRFGVLPASMGCWVVRVDAKNFGFADAGQGSRSGDAAVISAELGFPHANFEQSKTARHGDRGCARAADKNPRESKARRSAEAHRHRIEQIGRSAIRSIHQFGQE